MITLASKLRVSSESEYSDEDDSSKTLQMSLAQKHDCPNCPETFYSLKSYHRHLRSHLACYSAYECKECLVSFQYKGVYLTHKKEEQEKRQKGKLSAKTLSCCKKTFLTVSAFNRHQLTHQGPPYKCPICKESFPSVSSRSRHVKNHVIRCPLCDIYFQRYSELMSHVDLEHRRKGKAAVVEPIQPIPPEEISNSVESVSERILSLSEKNFICFVCEQRFVSEELMNMHIRAHKLFPCSMCPSFFPCSSQLEDHQLTEHEQTLQPVDDSPATGKEITLYESYGNVVEFQEFTSTFSTEELDTDQKPALDFNNLLHFNWLMKFTNEILALSLPLPVPLSEKLFHVISLLNNQLTYSRGLVDLGKNFKYFASVLKILSLVSSDNFLKIAELKQ